MRSGGDANPNFQEEIKTGQKTLFWRWKLVQGLQKCSVKLSNRNHHKSTLSGIYFGNVKDEIIWPSLHAPSWINLWTRSEKNLLGIMKIWIQDPALLLITIVSGLILKRSTNKEVSWFVPPQGSISLQTNGQMGISRAPLSQCCPPAFFNRARTGK